MTGVIIYRPVLLSVVRVSENKLSGQKVFIFKTEYESSPITGMNLFKQTKMSF